MSLVMGCDPHLDTFTLAVIDTHGRDTGAAPTVGKGSPRLPASAAAIRSNGSGSRGHPVTDWG